MQHATLSYKRGVTLLDTVVGVSLMLVVFVGIAAVFKFSVEVVTNNKARAGAIALANERMEYVRSLSYPAVGTTGGIPAGSLAQSEILVQNGVTYTRRTFVVYADDPADGTGAADTNGITADYKHVRIEVSWSSRKGTRELVLLGRISPTGVEGPISGGTLTIAVVNAVGVPVVGADVTITNTTTSPAINILATTNASGTITFIGSPAAANYMVSVTKSGYSTAETYAATAANTNPTPAPLTVGNGQTTNATFAIDHLASKTIALYQQIVQQTWSDSFADMSRIATSTNVSVAGGELSLTDATRPGVAFSTAISSSYLHAWTSVSWSDMVPPGASIVYRVYDNAEVLIPDAVLPGNSAGFTASPISLTTVSTSTYPSLKIGATLSASNASPSVDSWSLAYEYGPVPLPNVSFSMRGAKTIGSGPNGTFYKYDATLSSGATGAIGVPNLEWDTYTISVPASSGYDIASSCGVQPESLAPGASQATRVYLATHTTNSLLVDVVTNGAIVSGASVRLANAPYDKTQTTDLCGETFFGSLVAGTYTITVSNPGNVPYTATVSVSGTARLSVVLN